MTRIVILVIGVLALAGCYSDDQSYSASDNSYSSTAY